MISIADAYHEVLPNSIPAGSTLLMLDDPSSGEEHIVTEQVVNQDRVIYVAFDNFPDRVREQLERSNKKVKSLRENASLLFLDAYSKTLGFESTERYSTKTGAPPSSTIELLAEMMKDNPVDLIVVDSLNTVIRKEGVPSIHRSAHSTFQLHHGRNHESQSVPSNHDRIYAGCC